MGKKWYQSRTIWVGALTLVGLLNVVLRTITDEPIQ